jgi:hypothetical protein
MSASVAKDQYPASFCFCDWERGMYSSLETRCVGAGESMPLWRSRGPFRTHLDWLPLFGQR